MELKERWLNLCAKLKAQNAEEIWTWIEGRYSEPHRFYHNLTHLEHCFREYDADESKKSDVVELAIWFHDIIYETARADNEERSADLAEKAIDLMGLVNGYKYFTVPLILATKSHAKDSEAARFLDIDLSILGQSRQVYAKYENDIRKEYEWVPLLAFCDGRSRILSKFLAQDSIYQTEEFQEKYEALAKFNLRYALDLLESQKFEFLIEEIRRKFGHSSKLSDITSSDEYRLLLEAKPSFTCILQSLQKKANWTHILLLGDLHPELKVAEGLETIQAAVDAWLKWGINNNYLSASELS